MQTPFGVNVSIGVAKLNVSGSKPNNQVRGKPLTAAPKLRPSALGSYSLCLTNLSQYRS